MPTLNELAAELGIPAETLAAKADVVTKWNGFFSDAESKAAAGEKAMNDARALQATIDTQIANFGINETTVAGLQAQVAALKAAQAELEKNGFKLDLKIPDLPNNTPDPVKNLETLIRNGFTQMGQTVDATNRYFRVFGKPLPEDPATLADKAAAQRLSVHDYMERTYNISAEERKQAEAAETAKLEAFAEKKLQAYKEANPSTAGNPNLNGGVPSNFPAMPKPRESKDIREFSSMSARDKIANAMQRANEAAKTAAA